MQPIEYVRIYWLNAADRIRQQTELPHTLSRNIAPSAVSKCRSTTPSVILFEPYLLQVTQGQLDTVSSDGGRWRNAARETLWKVQGGDDDRSTQNRTTSWMNSPWMRLDVFCWMKMTTVLRKIRAPGRHHGWTIYGWGWMFSVRRVWRWARPGVTLVDPTSLDPWETGTCARLWGLHNGGYSNNWLVGLNVTWVEGF